LEENQGKVIEGKREQKEHEARNSTFVVLLSAQMRRVVDDFVAGDETRGQFRPQSCSYPRSRDLWKFPSAHRIGYENCPGEKDFQENGMPRKKDPVYVIPFLSYQETNRKCKNDFDIVK